MAEDNKNNTILTQLSNNFTNGMDTDTSDSILKSNSYRMAKNLRFVTNTDSSTGKLCSIEGTIKFGDISSSTVIHMDTIRDITILITIISGTGWYIYTIDNTINPSLTTVLTPILVKSFLISDGATMLGVGEDGSYHIVTVLRWESDDNIKLYLTDGVNYMRVINIMDSTTVTIHNDLNTFIYPSITFTKPIFIGFGSGNLKAGVIQYCYLLFNKNGAETEVSPLTELISISKGESSSGSNSVYGLYKDNKTDKSIKLKITDIDISTFSRIKIISVFYDENGQDPVIQLLLDSDVNDSTFYYEDGSNSGESTYTIDEFNAISGVRFVPKVIESKNNYLFASNILYKDNTFDVTYDARAYRFAFTDDIHLVDNDYSTSINYTTNGALTIANGQWTTSNSSLGYLYTDSSIEVFALFVDSSTSLNLRYMDSSDDLVITLTLDVTTIDPIATLTKLTNKKNSYILHCIGTGTITLSASTTSTTLGTGTTTWTINPRSNYAVGNGLYYLSVVNGSALHMFSSLYLESSDSYNYNFYLNSIPTISNTDDCINKYNDLSILHYNFTSYLGNPYTTEFAYIWDSTLNDIVYGGYGTNVHYRLIVGLLCEDSSGASDYDSGVFTHDAYGGIYYGNNVPTYNSPASTFNGVWVYNVNMNGETINGHFVDVSSTGVYSRNYSNPYISCYFKSLLRDEVYRYGVIFYNESGKTSPVKWIGDIRTPSMNELGFETFCAALKVSSTNTLSDLLILALVTKPLGIEFYVTIPDTAVAYEIVRCKRSESDRATLTQGVLAKIMSRNTIDSNDSTLIELLYTPTDTVFAGSAEYVVNTASGFDNHNFTTAVDYYYTLHTPEISYEYDTYKELLGNGDYYLQPEKLVFCAYPHTHSIATTSSDNVYLYNYIRSSLTGGTDTTYYPAYDYYYLYALSSSVNKGTIWNKGFRDLNYTVGKFYELSNYYISDNLYNRNVSNRKFDISDISFPLEAGWDKYASKDDFLTSIGGKVYNNWVHSTYTVAYASSTNDRGTILGPHGRCALMNLDNTLGTEYTDTVLEYPFTDLRLSLYVSNSTYTPSLRHIKTTYKLNGTYYAYPESLSSTIICNIRRSTTPYNGYNYSSREGSTYISNGKYFTITNLYGCVFDGDTYISNFDFVKLHKYHYSNTSNSYGTEKTDSAYKLLTRFTDFVVPIETPINLSLTLGPEYHKTSLSEIQLLASDINDIYILTTPLYTYNTAYSTASGSKAFVPATEYDLYNSTVDVRTYYSNIKSNDEIIDSWTKFSATNYIDVDTRYGEITNLRLFRNELLYWLDGAFGKFSVNERSVLTDDSSTSLVLGTGGILSRYDYLSTVNGMKVELNCDAQSELILYWFDYIKNELCAYTGNDVHILSKEKNVLNYINLLKLNNKLKSIPILSYDKYFNELVATISTEESLIYNERVGFFTSVYSMVPTCSTNGYGRSMYSYGSYVYVPYINKTSGSSTAVSLLGVPVQPYLLYIINNDYQYVKVFDNIEFSLEDDNVTLISLSIAFNTDSKISMSSTLNGSNITNREYSYRASIPRSNSATIGNRLRGRVLYCSLTYADSTFGFLLPYIITKYRISNS